jgi:hypothetical protein
MKTTIHLLLSLILLAILAHADAQPVIVTQPQNQTLIAGSTATFTVTASGTLPLSYQWRSYANGVSFTNISFGIEPTLVLAKAYQDATAFHTNHPPLFVQ